VDHLDGRAGGGVDFAGIADFGEEGEIFKKAQQVDSLEIVNHEKRKNYASR